ncbi:MAG: Gp15 family bacteriophage protein [Ruminococcus sp.]|nr:Gp15 family bacteriophage protein [Ruminococcus sp.]
MIGLLPTSLEVGGQQYAVRSDFRVVLNVFQALNDPELSDRDKAYVMLRCIYVNEILREHLKEAIERAVWFMDGGDMPKSKPSSKQTFDWEYDESLYFPAINKVAGKEVRSSDYMHWWTFLGYFNEVGEGLFSSVMNIRNKLANGKKLDSWERDFYNKNKDLINIRTAQDKADIAETEEALKEILGE